MPTINLPDDIDKSEIRDSYIVSLQFLDDAITQWPSMTGVQKQTWIANNFDAVLRIIRAMLKLFGKLLS